MRSRDDGPPREPEGREITFPYGNVYASPGVLAQVPPRDLAEAVRRHMSGEQRERSDEDRVSRERAIKNGWRMLSAYETDSGLEFWIVTEADRSATTALLPEEY